MPPVSPNWLSSRTLDILVQSYSNAARTVQVRGFSNSEQITFDHTTNSDRSLASSSFNVNDVPTMLTVIASATGVKRGELFVKVFLRAEGVIIGCLGSCYVTDAQPLVFPFGKVEGSLDGPGLIRTVTGTDQAAGTELSETVPTGVVWSLLNLQVTLVCSATVANRSPQLKFDDGTNVFYIADPAQAVGASSTVTYGIALGLGRSGRTVQQETWNTPATIKLGAGYRIKTATQSFQVGDDWSTPFLEVEEWIRP